jgi:hypothetical protein
LKPGFKRNLTCLPVNKSNVACVYNSLNVLRSTCISVRVCIMAEIGNDHTVLYLYTVLYTQGDILPIDKKLHWMEISYSRFNFDQWLIVGMKLRKRQDRNKPKIPSSLQPDKIVVISGAKNPSSVLVQEEPSYKRIHFSCSNHFLPDDCLGL